MKSFRNILSEVAEPKAGDEKHFKDKHITVKNKHPVAGDNAFTGGTKKAPKRLADHEAGEDAEVYEGLDPVNKKAAMGKFKHRADKDIDNDGDVDSSDKYLHARRNAITKAVHKEEAEGLDEISKKTLGSYVKKASDRVAQNKADYTSAHSGELSKQGTFKDRLDYKKQLSRDTAKRKAGVDKAIDRLTKEEVEELDEISRDTARSYIRKAMAHKTTGETPKKDRSAGVNLAGKKAYGIGGKAKVSATESVEQVDEVLKPTTDMGTWIKDFQKSDAPQFKGKSKEKRRQMAIAAKYGAEREAGMREESELEEKLIGGQKKLDHNKNGKIDAHDFHLMRKKKMKEEVEQLDELSPKVLRSYMRKSAGTEDSSDKNIPSIRRLRAQGKAHRVLGNDKEADRLRDKAKKRDSYFSKAMVRTDAQTPGRSVSKIVSNIPKTAPYVKAAKTMPASYHKEEVEQLDELSPNTLHSYVKKAAGNLAGNAAVAAAQASSSMKKSSPDVKRNIRNRMRGITGASGRLADKANMAENAWEEVPMMMRQLQFIMFAAEEIMEYLDTQVDPEEWFQNKLAHIHDQMQTLQAYAEGDMRMMSRMDYRMYGEETEELDEDITKMSHGRLKWHMNSGVPHGSYTKDEMKAERDRRLKTDPMGYRSAKAGLNEVTQPAVKKTVTFTGSDGKAHTRNVPIKRIDRDEHGQEKIRESVELDEAFKVGMIKLNDGGSVILKKEDVDVLNSLFKSLSSTNRKKMESTAMKDKNGFNEILSFAREAM
jgi:hypothetical protein